MTPIQRCAFAREILSSNTSAYNLLRTTAEHGGNLEAAEAAFLEETRKDLEGTTTLRAFEEAASAAAVAVLVGEEPIEAHIGRVLYWNPGLYMSPGKVRALTAAITEELA
jgi:hypothetical protein